MHLFKTTLYPSQIEQFRILFSSHSFRTWNYDLEGGARYACADVSSCVPETRPIHSRIQNLMLHGSVAVVH